MSAATGSTGGGQPAPAVRAVPACPLAPALASPGTLIDYGTAAGAKLWKSNTEALSSKYDGTPAKLRVFIADVQRRAQTAGWSTITTITVGQTDKDLFQEYGLIDLKYLHAAAIKVFAAGDRNTQNSAQMYTFLFDSITETSLNGSDQARKTCPHMAELFGPG